MLDAFASSDIESAARPLLELGRLVCGLQTLLICTPDDAGAGQRVRFAFSVGEPEAAEGSLVDWHDAEGRSRRGINAYVALPLQLEGATVGTLCAVGMAPGQLSANQQRGMRLIADALEHSLLVDRNVVAISARADAAEQALAEARDEAVQFAADSLEMQRLAHTDVLTGLPNRRGFMTRWEDQLARSVRRDTPLGLLLIDADHFKQVNDTQGHAMGDAVLRAIGTALLVSRQSPDIVARLGGDEFALVTTNADTEQLASLADEIRRTFAVVAEELGVETTLSIGIVSSESCPRETMLADADEALYRSKAAGGDTREINECDRR